MLTLIASAPTSAQDPVPEATEQWQPEPPVVSAVAGTPPSDAVVLFDGRDLAAWIPVKPGSAGWRIEHGAMVVVPGSGDVRTTQGFGDVQLHLEWRAPATVEGSGQHRGNSGVFFMGRYELQILDSWRNTSYVNGQAASLYKQHAPRVNASRAPGEWQSFDVVFIAPRFSAEGQLASPARMTVLHNGVLVHHDAVLAGSTVFRGEPSYRAHAAKLPLQLQEHGSAVAFRNIWVRDLAP